MANIIEVCLLEGPDISKIYSFIGDDSKTAQASKKSTIPIKFINADYPVNEDRDNGYQIININPQILYHNY